MEDSFAVPHSRRSRRLTAQGEVVESEVMKEIGNEEMQDLRGETPEVRLIGEGGGEVNVKEFSLGETARRIIESLPKFGKVSTSREN